MESEASYGCLKSCGMPRERLHLDIGMREEVAR